MIAANIKPSITTTNASIMGLAALQLYTLAQSNEISFLRNSNINLANNNYMMTELESA